MKKLILVLSFLLIFIFTLVYSTENATVIKVKGVYGIIDKGANQGVQQGQELFVKRVTSQGIVNIGKVRVIRTTANRAAVEQMTTKKRPFLQKGDRLSATNVINEAVIEKAESKKERDAEALRKASRQQFSAEKKEPKAFSGPMRTQKEIPVPQTKAITAKRYHLKKPWITLNVGAIVPSGGLANEYVPSFKLGGSYMLPTGRNMNIGVEINKTFFGVSSLGSSRVIGTSTVSSSSVLEGFVLLQKFLGDNFFVEAGGGIYRPKIEALSSDDIKSTFSSTNFGVFGGAGFYLPTSPYAGIMLKGRVHNFFSQQARQYFGLTGGFRFQVH
ncbi:MAG: hypothetical protein ACE5IR_00115 [bacterium]